MANLPETPLTRTFTLVGKFLSYLCYDELYINLERRFSFWNGKDALDVIVIVWVKEEAQAAYQFCSCYLFLFLSHMSQQIFCSFLFF